MKTDVVADIAAITGGVEINHNIITVPAPIGAKRERDHSL
jgi:hypothetical protein